MIETITKIIETSAKYAWGLLVVCIFVLFCPIGIATQIGVLEIRTQYLGYWWILLIFSTSICISLLWTKLCQLYATRKQNIEKFEKSEKAKQAVIDRLYSLNDNEMKWICYCLLKNVQTLHATQIHPTANSLLSKRIVVHGSGAITSLPFTIVDFVWEYLVMHRDEFLPSSAEDDRVLIKNLESFESSLRRIY